MSGVRRGLTISDLIDSRGPCPDFALLRCSNSTSCSSGARINSLISVAIVFKVCQKGSII